MALINCPECGQEVSDKSINCPKCGFPISSSIPYGTVKIKISAVKRNLMGGKQRVSIIQQKNAKVLWEGYIGQIAEIDLDSSVSVIIKYHVSPMYYGGECIGVLDPAKSKKYNVSVRQGMFKVIPSLQIVDMIDSD